MNFGQTSRKNGASKSKDKFSTTMYFSWIKPLLYLVSFFLLMTLFQIGLALRSNHNLTELEEVNLVRLTLSEDLNNFTLAVSGLLVPANRLFVSENISLEREEFATRVAQLKTSSDSLSKDISSIEKYLPPEHPGYFQDVLLDLKLLESEADDVFANYAKGENILASKSMASMDELGSRIVQKIGKMNAQIIRLNHKNLSSKLKESRDFAGYQIVLIVSASLLALMFAFLFRRTLGLMRKKTSEDQRNSKIFEVFENEAILAFADTQGNIVEVNEKFCQVSGYSRSELYGSSHGIVDPKIHSEEFFETIWKTLKAGEIWKGIITKKRKSGSYFDVYSVIAPLEDASGQAYQYFVLSFEVTKQRNLEQLLTTSQKMTKIGSWQMSVFDKTSEWSDQMITLFDLDSKVTAENFVEVLSEKMHPGDKGIFLSAMNEVLGRKKDVEFEVRTVSPHDGSFRYLRATLFPDLNSEAEVYRITGTFQDVTKTIETDMQFEFIMNNMSEGVCVQNPDMSVISYNRSAPQILSVNEKQMVGSEALPNNWRLVSPEGRVLNPEEYPVNIARLERKPVRNLTLRLMADGYPEKWVRFSALPITLAGKNVTISSFIDISEIMHANAELLRYFDVAQDLLCIIDSDAKFRFVNRAFVDGLGYQMDEIIGQPYLDFVHADDIEITRAEFERIRGGNRCLDLSNRYLAKDGSYRTLLWSASVDESRQLIYGAARDITQEIVLKQQLDLEQSKSIQNAKMASLGQMAAGIAHEINNPLAIISGTIHILKRDFKDDSRYLEKFQMLTKSVERISKIVQGLKKFSHTSNRREYKRLNLDSVLREAMVLVETKARRHGVEIQVVSQGNFYCQGNEIEIEQVIVNLLTNAIDAIKKQADRWVKISISSDQTHHILQVLDSGPGIPIEIKKKLFDPFFTTKNVGDGTGLGLSIVKGILDEHNANIDTFTKDRHTCFEIRFPLDSASNLSA